MSNEMMRGEVMRDAGRVMPINCAWSGVTVYISVVRHANSPHCELCTVNPELMDHSVRFERIKLASSVSMLFADGSTRRLDLIKHTEDASLHCSWM